jgi:hypothetical protein
MAEVGVKCMIPTRPHSAVDLPFQGEVWHRVRGERLTTHASASLPFGRCAGPLRELPNMSIKLNRRPPQSGSDHHRSAIPIQRLSRPAPTRYRCDRGVRSKGRYLPHPEQSSPPSMPPQAMLSRLRVHLMRPFAIFAFKLRQRREWRRIIPRRWLSPGELLIQDLENYEPQGTYTLDSKFIDDFAKARDDLLSQIKKQLTFSAVVFVYLGSSYLGIGLGFSGFGFSLKDTPGVSEGLLLASNLLACYTLMLQANVYLIESAIKHAISRTVPEELRTLYLVRYFPHEHFGVYRPFNLPHIIPNGPSRALVKVTSILFLLLLAAVTIGFAACNFGLLLYFLWFHPQLGIASYVLLIFILACGLCTFLYLLLTRCRLPYLDYTVNNELELLKQVDPRRYQERLTEIYGKLNEDKKSMIAKGFLT